MHLLIYCTHLLEVFYPDAPNKQHSTCFTEKKKIILYPFIKHLARTMDLFTHFTVKILPIITASVSKKSYNFIFLKNTHPVSTHLNLKLSDASKCMRGARKFVRGSPNLISFFF